MEALDDLAAGQLFIGVPEAAALLGCDERTIRRALAKGEIPGQRLGARWAIPSVWLRQQAGLPEPAEAEPLDIDEVASRVASEVVARLSEVLAAARAAREGTQASGGAEPA
jgi:excisionase family DNA binding protein